MTNRFIDARRLRRAVVGLLPWAALAMLVSAAPALAVTDTVERAYQRFIDAEHAMAETASRDWRGTMAANYARTMAPRQAASAMPARSTEDIDLLFRAAYDTAFYTFDRRYVEDMSADLAVLRSRHADRPRHYRDIYEAWVRVRDFRAAADVLAQQPDAIQDRAPAIIGKLVDGHGPSALVPSDDGATVIQQAVVLGDGIDIVVIGHPRCHFSRDAVAAIEASPSLKAPFLHHARWLMPQDGRMATKDVTRWNAGHSVARMSYIYRQEHWPAIDTWDTPTFYFFKNGKRVGKLVGWPPNGQGEAALRKELEKLGLL